MAISKQIILNITGELLQGIKNSSNRYFTTENKFVQSSNYDKIRVMKNGQIQLLGHEYIAVESVVGAGYDTIIWKRPPRIFDSLTCDYLMFKK